MLLDNQLQIRLRVNESNRHRMCGNVDEVKDFLFEALHYELTDIEYRAIDALMQKVLPTPRGKKIEQKRHQIVTFDGEHLSEWDEDSEEEAPLDMRVLGIEYSGAMATRTDPVAAFFLGPEDKPIKIHLWRRLGEEATPFNVAKFLWQQQMEHLSRPEVPNVKADLVPFVPELSKIPEAAGTGYTVSVGKESFHVNEAKELVFLLETLISHRLQESTANFIFALFSHLSHFPKKTVSAPVFSLYNDKKGIVYVGGEGRNNGRQFEFSGKLYPQFFTGLSGNVFMLRMGVFEDVVASVFVSRD